MAVIGKEWGGGGGIWLSRLMASSWLLPFLRCRFFFRNLKPTKKQCAREYVFGSADTFLSNLRLYESRAIQ